MRSESVLLTSWVLIFRFRLGDSWSRQACSGPCRSRPITTGLFNRRSGANYETLQALTLLGYVSAVAKGGVAEAVHDSAQLWELCVIMPMVEEILIVNIVYQTCHRPADHDRLQSRAKTA